MYIREGINSVFNVGLGPDDIHKICCGNASKIMSKSHAIS
jgi:hypothetical protein